MIPQEAVKTFLKRPRQDARALKRMSAAEIEQRMQELPVRPPLWKPLRKHQKVMFLLAVLHGGRLGLLCDTGTGKTCTAIALARYFKRAGRARKILVLVPSRVNKDEWAREIEKHSRYATWRILPSRTQEKWDLVKQDQLLTIETYAGMVQMCCVKGTDRKGKPVLVPDKRKVAELCRWFDGIVCDEAHRTKGHGTLTFRILRQLSKTCKVVLPMTGTPFGRDPQDLWAQIYLVDGGYTLGETLGLYRAAFFKEKPNPFSGGMDYTFDKTKEDLLNRFLAHASIRYEADAADLPRVVAIRKEVTLPDEAHTFYDQARKAIVAAKGNYHICKSSFLRMRQISSGFLGFVDDETGARASYEFPENPKLDMLLSILESLRPDAKAVVCHEFILSGDRIVAELRKAGIGFDRIGGETKDTAGALRRFDQDPACQVLVLSNSMAIGLNLQTASYLIFYESPVSVITRKQAVRRVERQESAHSHIFVYDLVMQHTVDELILAYHKLGEDLFQSILNGKVKL